MKISIHLVAVAILFVAVSRLQAQLPVGGHAQFGGAGILSASIPPPGIYLRDANLFYVSGHTPGLAVDLDVFAYIQQPRLFWITEHKILGANYGMSLAIPSAYISVAGALGNESQFHLADPPLEPLLLAWHAKHWDAVASYSVFVPIGHFDNSTPLKRITSAGKGFWSHMLTFGAVWRPDETNSWALSLLNRYEICHKQDGTHIVPGDVLSVEWGLSKSVGHDVDLGFVGYYQQQITRDSGARAATSLFNVVGIGPEIRYTNRKTGIVTSLRYFHEVEAGSHPQGSTLTLGKRF